MQAGIGGFWLILSAVSRALTMAAFRDPDPQQSLLELRPGARKVSRLVGCGIERPLRLAPRCLRLFQVDLGRQIRCLGHHNHLVRPDLEEAADDRERLLPAALLDPELTDTQGGDQWRMVRQDAQLAFHTGNDDHIHIVLVREPLRRDDLEMERHLRCQLCGVGAHILDGARQKERLLGQSIGPAVQDLPE